jgi:hypothetical protein
MQDFYLDTLGANLQLHSNSAALGYWLQIPIQGLDMPNLRNSGYDKPGEDGSVVSNQLYSGHSVTLTGVIKGDTSTQYETNRLALASALAISRDSNGFVQPKRCTFTTLAGSQYFFDAYLADKPIYDSSQINWTHFMIPLVIPKALIFSTTQVSSGSITRASGGGFILPVILPITSSAATGGSATVANSGNAYTPPVLTLTGPLTNPFIRNATTDQSMQLNYTIDAASYVTIDMAEKTILLNGDSSILSTKTDDSNWWTMAPGNNSIIFSTGSASDTGNLQIPFYPGFLGV